jgi:hypothetical protein
MLSHLVPISLLTGWSWLREPAVLNQSGTVITRREYYLYTDAAILI